MFFILIIFPKLGLGTKQNKKRQKTKKKTIRDFGLMCTHQSEAEPEPSLARVWLQPVGSGARLDRVWSRTMTSVGHLTVPVEFEDVDYKYEYLSFSFPNGY